MLFRSELMANFKINPKEWLKPCHGEWDGVCDKLVRKMFARLKKEGNIIIDIPYTETKA
jgi:hypothetical protein